jgi:hypothetical protein
MFNNQRVGAKAKIRKLCKNTSKALETVVMVKQKNLEIDDDEFGLLRIHHGE